jgi:hypothetical protein
MKSHDAPKPQVIDYVTPSAERDRALPSFTLAALLAVPGGVCWVCFFLLETNMHVFGEDLLETLALLALFPAIACAMLSLLLFVRFRRRAYPWYVALNLLINISGLCFVFSSPLIEFYEYLRGVYQFCVQYWL